MKIKFIIKPLKGKKAQEYQRGIVKFKEELKKEGLEIQESFTKAQAGGGEAPPAFYLNFLKIVVIFFLGVVP